jgi:Cu(I)/Ag(I) efflux system protein CusF
MTRASLTRIAVLIFATVIWSICSNCGGTPYVPPENSGPAAAVKTTSHPAVGTVRGLNPAIPSIEIEHEDIKDLMPGMKMEFHVSDKSLLDGLAIGDRVDFTVENGVGGLRVTAIKKK